MGEVVRDGVAFSSEFIDAGDFNFGDGGRPFGTHYNLVMRKAREMLASEGVHDERVVQQRLSRMWENHVRSLRDWKQKRDALRPAPVVKAAIVFTQDELARIAEHFAMANDEIGQQIAAKIARTQQGPEA